MKAIKFLGMLLAAATISFGAVSCSNDDEDDINSGNVISGSYKSDLKKSADEIVLTLSYGKAYTEKTTAKFKDGLCTSYKTDITYSDAKLAEVAWSEVKEEAEHNGLKFSKNGKTITIDSSEIMKGQQYEYILESLQYEKDYFDRVQSSH